MRRTIQPDLELLEGKALLSGVSAATSGLVASMTAIVSKTATGFQVVMTLTETNHTSHDISVAHGPSNEGFTATQGGKTVWISNGGIIADYLALDNLKPHQSLSIGATWDGRSNEGLSTLSTTEGPRVSVTFTISNELDQGEATASVTLPKVTTVHWRSTHIVPPKPVATPQPATAVVPIGNPGPREARFTPSPS